VVLPSLTRLTIREKKPNNQTRQIHNYASSFALVKIHTDALDKNDAARAGRVLHEGRGSCDEHRPICGRKAIEKMYEDTFQQWPITDFNGRRERRHLNAIDNAVWSAGQWASTFQSQTGPVFAWGYWSTIYVREGDAWKIRMLTLSEHPRPASVSAGGGR
jgi:hypothetical protein